ncbi:hypothetical protein EJ04DRAFT_436412 [Polyplosphaeria fusca]|uniref:Zn(2)-C6 fungal-type domain-containing protein n=1 Tax=Polyplosphaeria fusca TaxID=682080 RepID=A0A9P4R109_9PLEO|nr:hypothetical protein EJ04DRAFT_436412 [Polyplosphaeria fusca]
MPSKSRGLRTTAGCLTCRKRRVKCDEARPQCRNCHRLDKVCLYPEQNGKARKRPMPRTLSRHEEIQVLDTVPPAFGATSLALPTPSETDTSSQRNLLDRQMSCSDSASAKSVPNDSLIDNLFSLDVSGFSQSLEPYEWYDLLAEDAINTIQAQNTCSDHLRWNFDELSLSRRQTPRVSPTPESEQNPPGYEIGACVKSVEAYSVSPWNSVERIQLSSSDLVYLKRYVSAVGPILDLFDPQQHFSRVVPHLALYNTGLLKSLLAVGASHMALDSPEELTQNPSSVSASTPPGSTHSNSSLPPARVAAEQYYYETLHYLAQTLLYASYSTSHEILATAIMISTYEMFGSFNARDNSDWAKHLRGTFWIQRSQDNDGETEDGLRRAVWWAWLRQDIWAAFREGRPTMTIWQPKEPLSSLSSDELATRILYLTAKCVQFAASPKEGDITGYLYAGERLLQALQQWRDILPSSFEAISVTESQPISDTPDDTAAFQPIWIHPPSHAAATQMFHFARIIVLLNQPSTGGLNRFQARGKLLRESMTTICGIALAQESQNMPSAFVGFQAVYAAALCVEDKEKQAETLGVLEMVLRCCKFPTRPLLDDLLKLWDGSA